MKKYHILAGMVCLMAAALLCVALEAGAATRITIPRLATDDTRHDYTLSLLRLALDKTVAEYGEYEIVSHTVMAGQSRRLRMLQDGEGLDLIWSMTSREREAKMLPIRIPLQKGLLGHRLFIIQPHLAAALAQVESLDDLKAFSAGQGHDWPDRIILEYNGLTVVPSATYPGCFKMLLGDRFECFPRGVIEPWSEIAAYPEGVLVVEKHLMLRYPAPMYFFVNRDNHALADRLEAGLRAALKDGSFDALFYNHPYHKHAFELAGIRGRKVIDLVNPSLPEKTPLHDKALWIDLDKLP